MLFKNLRKGEIIMPLENAPLSEWCKGPAGLCAAVNCDCDKCKSFNKKLAKQRKKAEEAQLKK